MAETSAGVNVSGRTSETCREPGPYRSTRNAQVIVFLRTGERFPADTDGATTTWTMGSEANEATPEEL
jgi:hypothetical protein